MELQHKQIEAIADNVQTVLNNLSISTNVIIPSLL